MSELWSVIFAVKLVVTLVVLLVLYEVFNQVRLFLFPREDSIKEDYPFHATYMLLKNQNSILDLALGFFKETQAGRKKKTFVITPMGISNIVMTTSVENVTHILKTNFENYGKSGSQFKPKLQGLLGDGIFNADGKQWFAHRKTSAHLFKLNKFRSSILTIFNDDLDQVLDVIDAQGGRAFDLHDLLHRFTLESISRVAFGIELGCIHNTNVNFAKDFDYCTAQINDSLLNPLWLVERFFTPKGWKYFYYLWRINQFAKKIITDRREMVKNGTIKDKSDLLSLYLDKDNFTNAEQEDGGKDDHDTYMEPNDKNLRDVILNMVIAGRDTTAQALSWTFYRFCLHPETQRKARAEVLAALRETKEEDDDGQTGERSELAALVQQQFRGRISFKALQSMRYVEACCMETLRLHPSVPKEAKCAFKPERLPDGTMVYPGDIVSFFPWCMGRDTDLWGHDAEDFKPERFLDKAKPSPFVFIAFQAGPRTCLGQNFAMLEMKCTIARMLLTYEFEFGQDPNTITYDNSLTLPMKGGMLLKATKLHHEM